MDEAGHPDNPAVTGEYVAAVARVRRVLRSTWDPDGTLVGDPDRPGAYEDQAQHLASLVWMGESPERLADYLSSGAVETDARPRLARSDLVSLAQEIGRVAMASRPSA